jgi:hypothetical protein
MERGNKRRAGEVPRLQKHQRMIRSVEFFERNGERVLRAERYTHVFPTNRPFVYVEAAGGDRLAELFVFSGVHPMNGRDETYETGEWNISEVEGGYLASISAKSTAWESKTYSFRCAPERFTYQIEVVGTGELADVLYFGGYYSESTRWSSGFFWSGQQFKQVFNPEPNIPEVFHLNPASGTKIE